MESAKTEVLVPSEHLADLLAAKRAAGKTGVLIVRPPALRADPYGAWPGIGTVYDYLTSDPFKASWTTELYLRSIIGFRAVGFEYREARDGQVDLIAPQGGTVRVSKDDILVVTITTPGYPVARPRMVVFENWRSFKDFLAAG